MVALFFVVVVVVDVVVAIVMPGKVAVLCRNVISFSVEVCLFCCGTLASFSSLTKWAV